MNNFLAAHRPGLGLIGGGAVLWILGVAFMTIASLGFLAGIGAVLVTIGQIIFWLGVVVLVIELVFGFFRGA